MTYLLRHRLNQAKAQLANGSRSITEIGLSVGFQTAPILATFFARNWVSHHANTDLAADLDRKIQNTGSYFHTDHPGRPGFCGPSHPGGLCRNLDIDLK
jgi:hypothetical protein